MNPNISLIVASMNRTDNLIESIYTWLNVKEIAEIIIVDYSSKIPLIEHAAVKEWLINNKITLIRLNGEKYFNLGKAYNIAVDFATQEKILKIDADYKNINSSWIKTLNYRVNRDFDFLLRGCWKIIPN
jgi:hypothetical protein